MHHHTKFGYKRFSGSENLLDKAGHVFFWHVECWEISLIIIKATYFWFFAMVVFRFTAQNVAAEVYRGMNEWKCLLTLLYTGTLLHTLQHYTLWWSFLLLLLFAFYCFCMQDDTVLSCNGTKNISCTLLLTPWGFLVDCAQGQGHPLRTPTWMPKSVWHASGCCWRWLGLCRNPAMDKSSPALEHLGPRWRWLGEYRPGHEGTWSGDTFTLQDCVTFDDRTTYPGLGLADSDKVYTMSMNDQTMRHRL